MSRKKKNQKQNPPRQVIPFVPRPATGEGAAPRIEPGTEVRVKAGVHDPDFPELDLSGWTAIVVAVDARQDPPNCHLLWSDETRANIDPVWRERCDREGLDFDSIWLGENELEPDSEQDDRSTAQLAAEMRLRPPAGLVLQENRIRSALGVPVGAQIPTITAASLLTYQRYLSTRLVFPLPGQKRGDKDEEDEAVTLVALPPFGEDVRFGLLAEIRRGEETDFVPLIMLSVDGPQEARELVEDYAFWFWSRATLRDEFAQEQSYAPGRGHPVWFALKAAASYGASLGATTGALLATDEDARYGLWVGMGVIGLFGALGGSRYGRIYGTINRIRFGTALGAIFGMCAGVLFGAAAGVMIVGAVGTIPGAILGSFVGTILARREWVPIGPASWAPLGACIGGLVRAALRDSRQALTGALIGVGAGATLAAFVVVALLATVAFAGRE